ncbi:AP2 domain transcription factor AP2XII-1 [Toxoplasma gondii ARI]|uniref:AP2 domain transcription factor AP2XII-1 n=1 Tax=Toxoplasma gondii ARI TaxID=1074872 RepID=A0A139Y911_TOXGO|nr:AP2 domain transcription factor AP2XII-1 [Toxoplasma gondii ARI]
MDSGRDVKDGTAGSRPKDGGDGVGETRASGRESEERSLQLEANECPGAVMSRREDEAEPQSSPSSSPPREEGPQNVDDADTANGSGEAGLQRPPQKRRLEQGLEAEAGVGSSRVEEVEAVCRKRPAFSGVADAFLERPVTLKNSSEEDAARLSGDDAAGASLLSVRSAGALTGDFPSSSSRLPAMLSGARGENAEESVRDAHTPAQDSRDSALASFAPTLAPGQESEYTRAKLWSIEKAFDAFLADQKANGRRQGSRSMREPSHAHPGLSAERETSSGASAATSDLSREDVEELFRQHGVSPRELVRMLSGRRDGPGTSPEELRAAVAWARQLFPAAPRSPSELRMYLQRAVLDRQKRLRERWGAEANPCGDASVYGDEKLREHLSDLSAFMPHLDAGREVYMQWQRSRGRRDFDAFVRPPGLTPFRDSSSRQGDFAASPLYSFSSRTPWASACKEASTPPAAKQQAPPPSLWNLPNRPQPYTLADVQEAMEGPEGVLRVARPLTGFGEDAESLSFASLPKGAETLFWSSGRGLYFLRHLERTKAGEHDVVGEAGVWVAASEEEFGGFIIHRKFSVAKFGFERAKMLACRWYNDRQEARRGQHALPHREKPKGIMSSDRPLSREAAPEASRFSASRAGELSGKAQEAPKSTGGTAAEQPRASQKCRVMDTTCPVPGVRYDSRDRAWLATWHDGVRQYKRCFSIKKYGFAKAKECAIRMKMSLVGQPGVSQSGRQAPFPVRPFTSRACSPLQDFFREGDRRVAASSFSLLPSGRGEPRGSLGSSQGADDERSKPQSCRGLVEQLLARFQDSEGFTRGLPGDDENRGKRLSKQAQDDFQSWRPPPGARFGSAAQASRHSTDEVGGFAGFPGFAASHCGEKPGGEGPSFLQKSGFVQENAFSPPSERFETGVHRRVPSLSSELANPQVTEEVEEFLFSLSTRARQSLLASLRRGAEDSRRSAWPGASRDCHTGAGTPGGTDVADRRATRETRRDREGEESTSEDGTVRRETDAGAVSPDEVSRANAEERAAGEKTRSSERIWTGEGERSAGDRDDKGEGEGGGGVVEGRTEKGGDDDKKPGEEESAEREEELKNDAYAYFTHLTNREWDLLDYLDTLDFETVDLDAVMPFINQVPKVRGVCFDRKGLYWISQWHSQQKKHREWFGVKRLGFRKAWALAVCVRRDAEKVEDEPVDYPKLPDYEEVLGVTYARFASGRYWVAHYMRPAAPSSGCLGSVGRKLFPVSESSFEEARSQAVAVATAFPLPLAFFVDPERRATSAFESARAENLQGDKQVLLSKNCLFNVFTWLNGGASWTNVRRWAHAKRMQLAEDDWPQQFFSLPSPAKGDSFAEAEKERAEERTGGEEVKANSASRAAAKSEWPVASTTSPAEDLASSGSPRDLQKLSPLLADSSLTKELLGGDRELGNAMDGARGPRGLDTAKGRAKDEERLTAKDAESRQATLPGGRAAHGGGVGGSLGTACEEELDEPLSPLDIESIVADAYESFSDEDAEGEGDGGKPGKRIRLPKIGGVYYKRDGNYKAWAASWHIQGKRTRRYFTVKKHGFRNAYLKAVRARREAERHEGISVKHRHHALVPGHPGNMLGASKVCAESHEVSGFPHGDEDSRLTRGGASHAAVAPGRVNRERSVALVDRATKDDEDDERDLQREKTGAGGGEACSGESVKVALGTRHDSFSDGSCRTLDKLSTQFEQKPRGGAGEEAEHPTRKQGQETGGVDEPLSRAASIVGGREVRLTSGVSVHLTPLERVAKAVDVDLKELTDRVSRAAFRGGDSRLFHRTVDNCEGEADEVAQGLDTHREDVDVTRNLEFAMARETLDVLLSDLYSVVAKLSGAGRWTSLVSPTAAEAEPLVSAWDRSAREERREKFEDTNAASDEPGYPTSSAQIHVAIQLVVIKHYLATVRTANRVEQIAPLLALFEPCIKQGMLPHECALPRLRWLVCQLCRASLPWLDESDVLTDALLYRHLEELVETEEAEAPQEGVPPGGQIVFSAGFAEGNSTVASRNVFTGESRVAGGFRTDSEKESGIDDRDEASLAALICLPGKGKKLREEADVEKDDTSASLNCESGKKTEAESQHSRSPTEVAASSVSGSEGKDGSSDNERSGDADDATEGSEKCEKTRGGDQRRAAPRTSSASTASGETPEKSKNRGSDALKGKNEGGATGTSGEQRDDEDRDLENVEISKDTRAGSGGRRRTGERRGQRFCASGGELRVSEESPDRAKTEKSKGEPVRDSLSPDASSRLPSRCGTPPPAAATGSCATVESDVPA